MQGGGISLHLPDFFLDFLKVHTELGKVTKFWTSRTHFIIHRSSCCICKNFTCYKKKTHFKDLIIICFLKFVQAVFVRILFCTLIPRSSSFPIINLECDKNSKIEKLLFTFLITKFRLSCK